MQVHYFNLSYDNRNNHQHVQPNVMMKKSWTTSSIASAIEQEEASSYTSSRPFQSRDLIREYLMKSVVKVPEIFKPQCHITKTFTPSVAELTEINLAYKHPLVIAEELQNDAGESLAIDSLKKLSSSAATATDNNSSIIVPQYRGRNFERPHLIGKVTPSIARTWEQLSHAMDGNSSLVRSEEEEDKQSYVLFIRKPFNFNASDSGNEFAVNKIHHHHNESEKFYDSIEEYGDDYEEEIDEVDVEEDEEEAGGGEMMADKIDSLELRRHRGTINNNCDDGDIIVWSIES